MGKKLYYKIGEACKKLDIQPYVLRYWETEFTVLKPNKSRSGQRVYTQEDLETIRRIKELLYDEGYTIAGAKKRLEAELAGDVEPDVLDSARGERIQTLVRGLSDAVDEARSLLAALDGESPS